jgi:hypothetical protein
MEVILSKILTVRLTENTKTDTKYEKSYFFAFGTGPIHT